jgi:ribonuclease T2
LIRRLQLALAVLLAAAPAAARGLPGDFDFYVLSLSWSPSYCAGVDPSRAQCDRARPFTFVVHGLWPQWRRGFPESCSTHPERIPDDVLGGMLDLMPSRGLVISEWRKHGTCSGLDPRAYFETLRRARAAVTVPRAFERPDAPATSSAVEVERLFLDANPGLGRDMLSVTCGDNMLREVRICFDRSLGFTACPALARRTCRASALTVPPARAR